MKEWFELLATKKTLKIIGEFFSYSVVASLKLIYLYIPTVVAICLLGYVINTKLADKVSYFTIILCAFIGALILPFGILYRRDLKIKVRKEGFSVGYLELITVKEGEEIHKDLTTTKANIKIEYSFQNLILNIPPYNMNLVTPILIKRPKLRYLTRDFNGLLQDLSPYVNPHGFLTILIPFKDAINNRLEFEILSAKIFTSESVFSEFKEMFDISLNDTINIEEYLLDAVTIFNCLICQTTFDLLIENEKSNDGLKIVNECISIFNSSCNRVIVNFPEAGKTKFISYRMRFESNLERYKAVFLLNLAKYDLAIPPAFKAIKLDPYFPYKNYEEFKHAFSKRYIIEISSSAINFMEPEDQEKNKDRIGRETKNLMKTIEYSDSPFHYELIREIILRADAPSTNSIIDRFLLENFCDIPMQNIIRGEVLKVMPKGSDKNDILFIERIPECVAEFQKVLDNDAEFVIMFSKIGALEFTRALNTEMAEPEQMELIERSVGLIKRGQDLFHELGMLD
jgi:hypothetical protein